jgi:predicted nucleic acid-binding protein
VYLVDTSVWIDYFKEIQNQAAQQFLSILDNGLPFGITSIIYQEILQGAKSEQDFNQLKNYLGTQRFFQPKNEIITYESAAKLFYLCRKKGITIRSSIDCLIAQIAIEHDLILLHNDKDYDRIQLVMTKLKLYN